MNRLLDAGTRNMDPLKIISKPQWSSVHVLWLTTTVANRALASTHNLRAAL